MRASFPYCILFITTLFLPYGAYASVYISEIAWMGSEGNANAEWIELYNDGVDTDLSGWTLSAIDGQPSIALTGILGAGHYALLERSSDDTVPSVSAFLVYTGALGNDGEFLELRDANGLLVDSVDGRGGWEDTVGGNNITKETLQRSGTPPTGAWTTGTPSPSGSAPLAQSSQGDESLTQPDTSRPVRTTGGNIIYPTENKKEIVKHEPALTIDVGGERTVSRGAPVTFLARGFSESGRELATMEVYWNFGDGAVAHGKEVMHTFWHEGQYVVTVRAQRVGVRNGVWDEEEVVVHVKEPLIEVVEATDAYITLHNAGESVVDISNWVLVAGASHFRLPSGTRILPDAQVPFTRAVTGVSGATGAHLFDRHGALVSERRTIPLTPTFVGVVPTVRASSDPIVSLNTKKGVTEALAPSEHPLSDPLTEEARAIFGDPAVASAGNISNVLAQVNSDSLSIWWWIFGLVTAIVTTILAVFLVRREREEVVQGFLIEEAE